MIQITPIDIYLENGADPVTNSKLDGIISRAKAVKMPKDSIESAIKSALRVCVKCSLLNLNFQSVFICKKIYLVLVIFNSLNIILARTPSKNASSMHRTKPFER